MYSYILPSPAYLLGGCPSHERYVRTEYIHHLLYPTRIDAEEKMMDGQPKWCLLPS